MAAVHQRLMIREMRVVQEEAPPRSRQMHRERKCKLDGVEGVVGKDEGEAEGEAGADEGVGWRSYRRRRDGCGRWARRQRRQGSSASSSRAVKFVDLLREGVVSKEEYERLVEPVKARKRKAERMAEQTRQPPSVRAGTVHRWTPAALASYESSTMQGSESADRAPG